MQSSMVDKTRTWWLAVLKDEARLNAWLVRLYNNEKDAYERFLDFARRFCKGRQNKEAWYLFHFIAEQERRHAHMVLDLLISRGIVQRNNSGNSERYWSKVLPCVQCLQTAAGVGALAEGLSLERMRVIISCKETPGTIRKMFLEIEPDESVHARTLADLAKKHGIRKVIDCHSEGLIALGLKLAATATNGKPRKGPKSRSITTTSSK